ncbi:MAG: DMT family transporter [Paludibacter sp.]|nr:DMT family transporter [Bacteroidales bacterium]MCM1068507.1 DMT family transporter [Prevotella sp.]MCM1353461.1 DMT family transporter [Bacteroides sp.]MCM1442622.1 DMT family transporter [Muribaculum sp.]MCM1481467.1 DMT family transporter [Paludibacter sp.]
MMKNKLWFIFALITVCTWGVWGAFSGYQIEHGIPDTVIYIVWALSMLPCALVALIINKGHLNADWHSVLLGCAVGFLGAGGQLILFKALSMGPAYIIYPFISMSPIVVITLAAIFLRERASRWQIAGIITALVAIFFFSWQSGEGNNTASGWLWLLLAVGALFAWGVQGFCMKFANNSMDAESIFIWMAITAVLLIPVAYFMNADAATFFAQPDIAEQVWSSFGIQILNSIGALTLVYAYRYGKAVVVSPMEGLSPMVTVVLSLLISQVIPDAFQITGFCFAAFAMFALSKG